MTAIPLIGMPSAHPSPSIVGVAAGGIGRPWNGGGLDYARVGVQGRMEDRLALPIIGGIGAIVEPELDTVESAAVPGAPAGSLTDGVTAEPGVLPLPGSLHVGAGGDASTLPDVGLGVVKLAPARASSSTPPAPAPLLGFA